MSPGFYIAIMLAPYVVLALLLIKWRGLPRGWLEGSIRAICLAVGLVLPFFVNVIEFATDHPPTPPWTGGLLLLIPIALFSLQPRWLALGTAVLFFGLLYRNWSMYQSIYRAQDLTWRDVPMIPRSDQHQDEFLIVEDMANIHEGERHAPGYVDEIDPQTYADATYFRPLREFRLERQWYTGLLDIWRYESRPARMWFDGGKLDQGKQAYHVVGFGEFRAGLNPPKPRP